MNIVLARVEFDLDVSRYSIQEVVKRLGGATGYTFEEYVQPEGQVLDVLVNDQALFCRTDRPFGVTLLEPEGKRARSTYRIFSGHCSAIPPDSHATSKILPNSGQKVTITSCHKSTVAPLHQHPIRIHYDARRIGARTILNHYEALHPDQDIQLAPLVTHPSLAIGAKQTKRACAVFLVTLVFTIPVLVFAWAPIDRQQLIYAHTSLALASVVQVIAITEFAPAALRSLVHTGLFEMDFLIAVSTTTAYIFSVASYVFQVQGRPLETGSFFETSTLLVTLILLGRVVNEAARFNAAKAVSFRSLQVEEALLVTNRRTNNTPETRKIDARLLQHGDHFMVPPHTRIVTDGQVTYGGSEVDESMVSGEHIPVAKGHGSPIYAGTNNGSGMLIVALTNLPHENSISRIATMVENAELTKPKTQALADRIAGWFVPTMATLGSIVFLIWLLVDRYLHHRGWGNAVIKAITYAISTLIVSCPCAIGLAVPMVILIASGVSARFGIIFRDPQKLEVARNVTDVVLDKTGTLTTGQLTVVSAKFYNGPETEVKMMLLGLLCDIRHPVSATVYQWLQKEVSDDRTDTLRPTEMYSISSIPGEGVLGICKGNDLEVRAGNPKWVGIEVIESDHTLLCVAVSGQTRAVFRLKDRIRLTAKLLIERLQGRGVRVHMLSGDSLGAVNSVAFSLSIPKDRVRNRLKPAGKQEYVQGLQEDGKVVMFVGDGTNDAVALKQADVGVHLNQGSDIAKSAADVVLLNAQLHDIIILLIISTAAYRRILLNFAWSALYNLVAILMAAGAFVKVRIEPAYAGLGELVSVLPVVLVAFQMKWHKYGREYLKKE